MMIFRHPDKPTEIGPDVVRSMSPSKWNAQWKYDGWNLSIYVDGPGNIRCLTSSGKDMTQHPKFDRSFVDQLRKLELPPDSALNAEFVGPRGGHEPAIYIFDALAWAGEWLVNEPWHQRWERCVQLPLTGNIQLATTIRDNFLDEFNRLKDNWIANGMGMDLTEGLVLKRSIGTMRLDRNRNHKSNVLMKIKYRDIRTKRF